MVITSSIHRRYSVKIVSMFCWTLRQRACLSGSANLECAGRSSSWRSLRRLSSSSSANALLRLAFHLAGTRAGGDNGGAPAVWSGGVKPLVGDALVAVRREAERDFREQLAAFRHQLGRQGDGEVGAFDEVLRFGEEIVEDGGKGGVGGAEAGGEEVMQGAGDFLDYDGGDHGAGLWRLLLHQEQCSHILAGHSPPHERRAYEEGIHQG